ncbi:T9SS type A sorting domain-containing protein [Candidatus Neomarinimicrobiota bacterium]
MAWRYTTLTILATLALTAVSTELEAQPDTVWTKTYGGEGNDKFYAIEAAVDGGFLLAGYTTSLGTDNTDGWLVRIDENGDTLWTRTYVDTSYACIYSITATSDSGFVLAGRQSHGIHENVNYDMWLLRVDKHGDLVWERTYGGEGYDVAHCIRSFRDGGFGVVGQRGTDDGYADGWFLRLDAVGDTLWSRTYGDEDYDRLTSLEILEDDGAILIGVSSSYGAGKFDGWIVRIDVNGDRLWTKTYGGPEYDFFHDVTCLSDGGFILAGSSPLIGLQNSVGWLVRIDANGDSLWTRHYDASWSDGFFAIQPTHDSGFVLVGRTKMFWQDQRTDAMLTYIDSLGHVSRTPVYGSGGVDYLYAIQATGDSGFVAAGVTTSSGAGGSDGWIVRVKHIENKPPQPFHLLAPTPDSVIVLGEESSPDTVTFIWASSRDSEGDSIFYQFTFEGEAAFLFQSPILTSDTLLSLVPSWGTVLKALEWDTLYARWNVHAWDSKGGYTRPSNGPSTVTFIFDYVGDVEENDRSGIPLTFALHPAYPNPFNPVSTIRYDLPQAAPVTLSIYDLLGREMARLVDRYTEPGYHQTQWDGRDDTGRALPSGIYIARLVTPGYSKAIKMVLLK